MKMIAIPFLTRHYLAKGHNTKTEFTYLEIESMPVFWRGNVPIHARISSLVLITKIQ